MLSCYKQIQNEFPVVKRIVNFLTAGLVDYSDVNDGKYLLRKEAIEKMLPTLEGRPLVVGHQEIDPNKLDEVAVGYITKGYWNPDTGSFDCEVLVKDPEVLNPNKNAVSCAYIATEFGEGGRYSGIEYDAEILNGEFTHIAIVDNPRYNDAKILVNGIKGAKGMIKRFFSNADEAKDEKKSEDEKKDNEDDRKDNEDEVKSLSPEDVVTIDNEDVPMKKLIEVYKNACGGKKNEDEEKDNEDDEKEKENEDADNDLVSKVTAIVERVLKDKHVQENKKKNEDDKKDKEDKEEKQNSLSVASMMRDFYRADNGYQTRADRIAESNKKYSL